MLCLIIKIIFKILQNRSQLRLIYMGIDLGSLPRRDDSKLCLEREAEVRQREVGRRAYD